MKVESGAHAGTGAGTKERTEKGINKIDPMDKLDSAKADERKVSLLSRARARVRARSLFSYCPAITKKIAGFLWMSGCVIFFHVATLSVITASVGSVRSHATERSVVG